MVFRIFAEDRRLNFARALYGRGNTLEILNWPTANEDVERSPRSSLSSRAASTRFALFPSEKPSLLAPAEDSQRQRSSNPRRGLGDRSEIELGRAVDQLVAGGQACHRVECSSYRTVGGQGVSRRAVGCPCEGEFVEQTAEIERAGDREFVTG